MGGLFSKKKPPEPERPLSKKDQIVLELRKHIGLLQQYRQLTNRNYARQERLARKLLLKGREDRARLLLKKKCFQEKLLDRSEMQLDGVKEMVRFLEYATMETKVLEGLTEAKEALVKLAGLSALTDMEKLLEAGEAGQEKQEELELLLGNFLTPEELAEVEAEMEDILAEQYLAQVEAPLLPPGSAEGAAAAARKPPLLVLDAGEGTAKALSQCTRNLSRQAIGYNYELLHCSVPGEGQRPPIPSFKKMGSIYK